MVGGELPLQPQLYAQASLSQPAHYLEVWECSPCHSSHRMDNSLLLISRGLLAIIEDI